jgi:diacylglycerol kinase
MFLSFRTLKKSFGYALKGFVYAFKHEQNFRIQTIIGFCVIIAAAVFHVKAWEAVALTGMVVGVLVLEIANTVIEKLIDLLKPRMEQYSGIVKDLMATAVLLSSLASIIVGLIIFLPYILPLLSTIWYNL